MPSSQTLFLHIGTEKTGTTTLQTMFAENRETLSNAGLLYPYTPGPVNHVGSALYALDLEDRPDLRAALGLHTADQLAAYRDAFVARLSQEAHASHCGALLISNEHLSSRLTQQAQIERLVHGLRQVTPTIRVVVYLRPQYELAPSWYSTSIKSGNTEPFSPPLGDGNYFYNYDKLLRNWEAVVSQGNITVRLFDRAGFVGGNLIDDFFAAIGQHRPGGLIVPSDKNTSLDAQTLEFLRLANKHVPWFVNGAQNSYRPALLQTVEAISGSSSPIADAITLGRIDAVFRDSNRRVAERYFPGMKDLFPSFTPSQPGANSGTLSTARAVELGINLWKRQVDRSDKPRRV